MPEPQLRAGPGPDAGERREARGEWRGRVCLFPRLSCWEKQQQTVRQRDSNTQPDALTGTKEKNGGNFCCCDMEIQRFLNPSEVKASNSELRTWLMYQPPVDSRL